MVRKIREDEPPKPSTRLTTLGEHSTQSAKRGRPSCPALKRELSGDLDWITMKALEKDRTRRYSSPQDSGRGHRALPDRPAGAGQPAIGRPTGRRSSSGGTRGASRRRRWVLVLIAFAATMAVQAKRIAAERDLASRRRRTSSRWSSSRPGCSARPIPSRWGVV